MINAETITKLSKLNNIYRFFFNNDICMNSFSERIRLQKLFYILQSRGLDSNYEFTWYVYGPYSSRLTDEGFLVQSNLPRINRNIPYTEEEERLLTQIRNGHAILNSIENIELVASYIYLNSYYGDQTTTMLNLKKPKFSISLINNIITEWNRLTNH